MDIISFYVHKLYVYRIKYRFIVSTIFCQMMCAQSLPQNLLATSFAKPPAKPFSHSMHPTFGRMC